MEIGDHFSRSTFVRSNTNVGHEGLVRRRLCSNSSHWDGDQASQVLPHQPPPSMSTVFAHHTWKLFQLPRMPWYAEALKVPFTGIQGPKQPSPQPPVTSNLTLRCKCKVTIPHNPVRYVLFSWHLPNPDSAIRCPEWVVTLESISLLLWNPVVVCFTPLHLMYWLALGYVETDPWSFIHTVLQLIWRPIKVGSCVLTLQNAGNLMPLRVLWAALILRGVPLPDWVSVKLLPLPLQNQLKLLSIVTYIGNWTLAQHKSVVKLVQLFSQPALFLHCMGRWSPILNDGLQGYPHFSSLLE